MSRDFCFWFFHESSAHKPLKITLMQGHFNFFRKFKEIFASQGALLPRYRWHRWQICHLCRWCHWYQWQIMGTISDCLFLIVNLKKNYLLFVNSTTQRCPYTLSCEYFREFSRKNRKGQMGYSYRLRRNWFIKNTSWHRPFNKIAEKL